MIRERSLTAVAVTEHALERIASLNPAINAFVAVDGESALTQAAAIDERIDKRLHTCSGTNIYSGANPRNGADPHADSEADLTAYLPLAGIPVGVKDLENAVGFPTRMGALRHRYDGPASSDSTHVARLRAAGCVIVGKTNTPEYGFMSDTYNPLFGATLNPWNLKRSPGGSSGGTAAAIASGMIPLGTGSDGGGSIRIPAAACGFSGIKPSHGRVPSGPPPSGATDLSSAGPMALRTRDIAFCLDAVIGPHPADMRSLPAPDISWRSALNRSVLNRSALDNPASPNLPKRVLWTPSMSGEPVDSEIAAVCAKAVQQLANTGVDVVELDQTFNTEMQAFMHLFIEGVFAPIYDPLRSTDAWEGVTEMLKMMLDYQRSLTENQRSLKTNPATPASSMFEIRMRVGLLSVKLAKLMKGFNVLLTPTVAGQTPISGGQGTINGEHVEDWIRFTPLANLTRRPAGTVCCGFTSDKMPVGLQIIGHQLDDLTVLKTMTALEDLLMMPLFLHEAVGQ